MFRYKSHISVGDLLTKTDSSLTKAKADENSNSYLYKEEDKKNALGKDQWRSIIDEAINNNGFKLKFYSAVNTEKKELDHKVMTFIIQTNDQKKYYFGDFIAPAINFGLVSKMFLISIKKLLSQQEEKLSGKTVSIRLSNEYMKDINALDELTDLLRVYSQKIDFKLLFEVSNSFAIHNTQVVKSFVDMFSQYGVGFGINSFTGESSDFSYLKELNPAFIKADTSYLLDQSEESMHALALIAGSLDVEIIATFVKELDEVQKLSKIHVGIVQGPVSDSII